MFSFTTFDSLYNITLVLLNAFWTKLDLTYWSNMLTIYHAQWNALTQYLISFIVTTNPNTSYSLIIFSLIYKTLVYSVLTFGLLIGFMVYLMNQGVQLISFNLNGTESFSDIFATFAEVDDEIGALDDVLIYGLMFLVIIAWFIFFTIFAIFYVNNLTWFVMLLNFIFLTAILTPIFVLYSFGGAFPTFIRGVGRTTSVLMETFLDFVAIGVMISRFLIQNIRLLLIFTAFFELSEYIYMSCDFEGAFVVNKFLSLHVTRGYHFAHIYWYEWVIDFLITQLLLIYYWGHLTLTFIVQLINYFCLSFFLFYFLYTTFVLEAHEKYFFYKRILN